MKIIFGLGNSKKQYDKTRHNVGFIAADYFADTNNLKFKDSSKFNAYITEFTSVDGEKIMIVKPTTMMNLSGDSVRQLRDFYKFESRDVLVICDDLDRDFGECRVRTSGGHGGQNGLRSIINILGEDFYRLRIGIANELRGNIDSADFVLSRFSKTELETIKNNADKLTSVIDNFIDNKLEATSFQL
jgi:PTH1 family peptidyl-tRNA hydrolase